MKKLIFLTMAVLLGVVAANAQTYTLKSTYGGTTDSVTNTGTNWLKTQITGTGTVTIQLNITKISGTGAGTAILQGSLDGTNWIPVSFSAGIVTGGGSTGVANDTFTLTNVTSQQCAWYLTTNMYSYYRVYVTGSGTELLRLSATAIQRKQ